MAALLDLAKFVAGILPASHGGTGSDAGEGRVVVRGINSTGADIELWSIVEYTFGTNAAKVQKVAAANAVTVVGVVVGYFDGDGSIVEDDAPDGYEVAVCTAGIVRALIGASVTRGQYAFSHATDGKIQSSSTAAAGAFGWIVTSADTGLGHTTCWISLPLTASVGAGGSTSFGTPALTLSTSNAAGAASTAIRTDATIAIFDSTNPTTAAFGDSPATGSGTAIAGYRGHRHGMPANPVVGLAGGIDIIVGVPAVGDVCDLEMPFAGVWTSWRVFNDSAGSIQYDLWKDTYANFAPTVADTITASAKPLTSSAAKNQDSTLTGWTTSFSAGDIVRVHIDSTSGGLVRSVLSLRYTRS